MDSIKNQMKTEKKGKSKKKRTNTGTTKKQSSVNLELSSLSSAATNFYEYEVIKEKNDEAYLSQVKYKSEGSFMKEEFADYESTETPPTVSMKQQKERNEQAEGSFSVHLAERFQSSIYVSNIRNLTVPSNESEQRLLLESDPSCLAVSESEFPLLGSDSSFEIISECNSPSGTSFSSMTASQLGAIPKSVLLERRSRKGLAFLDISECILLDEPPTLRSAPPTVVHFDRRLPVKSPFRSGARPRSECESPSALMSQFMCGESESKLPLLAGSSGDSTPRSGGWW